MKTFIVISLVVFFMLIGFLVYKRLQQLIQPEKSLSRLLFYFIAVLVSIFILSFLMVLLISKIYPDELMK